MTQLLPSELAKLAAESEGKTHAEAMRILKKENPDWAAGDLADVANSVSPTMDAASRKVQKRYQALTKSARTESSMLLPSELARIGKFPAGVSMTVDEVAAVVGPEFKEMNENPPPEVIALRDEMTGKTAAVADEDLFEAVKSAKKVGQKTRNVKDAAWKLAIRAGYIQLKGLMFELTPMGEVYYEAMLLKPGFTRWADEEEKIAAKRKMPAADMSLVVKGKFPNAYVQLSGLFGEGSEDISAAVDAIQGFTDERSKVSDAEGAKALMEKAKTELSKNKSFKVNLSTDALDLPELTIKWVGKTARFEEGPEGAKQFEAWMEKQPQSVQDDWKKYTEENGDKFKTASASRPLSLLNQAMISLSEVDLPGDSAAHGEFAAIANDLAGLQARLRTFLRANGKMASPEASAALSRAGDLAGDLNGQWDKVARAFLGSRRSGEVARLAQIIEDLEMSIMRLSPDALRVARFEEGQPADPTADMSPEDKAAWEANTEKYKDKFTDEEAMMDKFQDQLLPSETYSLKSARQRSTWPKVGTDRNSVLKFLCGDEFIYPPPQFGGVYYFSQEAPLAKSTAEAYIRRLRTRAERMGVTVTGEELQELYAARVQITLPESITASSTKEADIAEDIGATVPGPLVQDKEEKPFLSGQFTQVENSELSSKFAADEAYAEGTRVKQDGGKEGVVTKAKMVGGKQMYEVKWDGASSSVDRKHADLKPVKTAGQKVFGTLEWLE